MGTAASYAGRRKCVCSELCNGDMEELFSTWQPNMWQCVVCFQPYIEDKETIYCYWLVLLMCAIRLWSRYGEKDNSGMVKLPVTNSVRSTSGVFQLPFRWSPYSVLGCSHFCAIILCCFIPFPPPATAVTFPVVPVSQQCSLHCRLTATATLHNINCHWTFSVVFALVQPLERELPTAAVGVCTDASDA